MNKHPDVMLFYDSDQGVDKIQLYVVTVQTPRFPSGLPLDLTFSTDDIKYPKEGSAEKDAERVAILVQEYIDLIRKKSMRK